MPPRRRPRNSRTSRRTAAQELQPTLCCAGAAANFAKESRPRRYHISQESTSPISHHPTSPISHEFCKLVSSQARPESRNRAGPAVPPPHKKVYAHTWYYSPDCYLGPDWRVTRVATADSCTSGCPLEHAQGLGPKPATESPGRDPEVRMGSGYYCPSNGQRRHSAGCHLRSTRALAFRVTQPSFIE